MTTPSEKDRETAVEIVFDGRPCACKESKGGEKRGNCYGCIAASISSALAAAREEDAKIVDALAERYKGDGCLGYVAILREAAAAIRGRRA